MLFKLVFLNISQNSQERTCARVLLNKVTGLQLYKKKKLAQVLILRYFWKTPFYRTPPVAASAFYDFWYFQWRVWNGSIDKK